MLCVRAMSGNLGINGRELEQYLSQHHVSYTFVRDEFFPNPAAPLIQVKETLGY